MWTHADTVWTDVDCPQKYGQMQTINSDSTKTHSMQTEEVWYRIVHLQYGEQVLFFQGIKFLLLPVLIEWL